MFFPARFDIITRVLQKNKFDTVEDCLAALARGEIVVVTDDEDRENEGDCICAARFATTANVNFMATYAKGLICMPMSAERCRALELPQMVGLNTDNHQTAFTVSIDATAVTTGISAEERSMTALACVKQGACPADFRRPGHMFPLEARKGGVLKRAGHTEATVDMCRLAGLEEAGLCCEIMNADGTMARMGDLEKFVAEHNLKFMTIADLIAYRRKNDKLVEKIEEVDMPTEWGHFRLSMYRSTVTGLEHLALVKGNVAEGGPVLVRVHSECFTGDVLGSARCDCGDQLHEAMRMIEREGRGAVLYMRQEGRGIGLANKLHAYRKQEAGMDTVEANVALGFAPDLREYGEGAQILGDLGISEVRLMTNNPCKIKGLAGYGIIISERVPVIIPANKHNQRYLETKREKMDHLF